jgi:hypothetical protein
VTACLLVLALMVGGTSVRAATVSGDVALSPTRLEHDEIMQSNILSETTWMSTAGPGGELGRAVKLSYRLFDADGRVLERTTFNSDGTVLSSQTHSYEGARVVETRNEPESEAGASRTAFTYDDEGHLIESVAYASAGAVVVRIGYAYDSDGRMTEMITSTPAGVSVRFAFGYDEAGNLVETTAFDADDVMRSRSVNTYDADGNKLSATGYDPTGGVVSTTSYSYSSDGALRETTIENADGAVLHRTTSDYDPEGKVVQTVLANPAAGTLWKILFEYDDAGMKALESRYNKLDQLAGRTKYVYEYRDGSAESAEQRAGDVSPPVEPPLESSPSDEVGP